jgi:hypothetical protein
MAFGTKIEQIKHPLEAKGKFPADGEYKVLVIMIPKAKKKGKKKQSIESRKHLLFIPCNCIVMG